MEAEPPEFRSQAEPGNEKIIKDCNAYFHARGLRLGEVAKEYLLQPCWFRHFFCTKTETGSTREITRGITAAKWDGYCLVKKQSTFIVSSARAIWRREKEFFSWIG